MEYPKQLSKQIVQAAEGVYVWKSARFAHAAKCSESGKDFVVWAPTSQKPKWLEVEKVIEPVLYFNKIAVPAEIQAAAQLLLPIGEKK